MNYIIIICISVIMLHFMLYYLNIDPFELSNNTTKQITNTYITGHIDSSAIDSNTINKPINKDIEASINELKKLNEYIDNECGNN